MKMKRKMLRLSILLTGALLLGACRGDDEQLVPATWTQVQPASPGVAIRGVYVLNEGNMGSNKSTLDYFDYTTGYYRKNIYAETNPNVVLELGDTGNDLQVYGGKLYAVINYSGYVEVMDAATARHIGSINIPNCRYIAFSGGKAYVSSYAGPILVDPNARPGCVVEIDTATLAKTREITVGYQPENMIASNGKLYVANSGGYRVPNYDRTVSVVDLDSWAISETIDVAINLHRMERDRYGRIYVSSRGNYMDVGSNIYVIDSHTNEVCDTLNIPVSNMCMAGDSLFILSNEYDAHAGKYTVAYALYDVKKQEIVTNNFISDRTEERLMTPYGLAVNPLTREIFLTDAKDYVSPGILYCFTPDGRCKWSVTTGDVPAHFAFYPTLKP